MIAQSYSDAVWQACADLFAFGGVMLFCYLCASISKERRISLWNKIVAVSILTISATGISLQFSGIGELRPVKYEFLRTIVFFALLAAIVSYYARRDRNQRE